jgi:hypothetical protein
VTTRLSLIGGATACLLGSLAVGGFLASHSLNEIEIMALAVGAVLVLPIAVQAVSGKFDIFDPLVWAAAALATMFVVRPIALNAYGAFAYRNRFDLQPLIARTLTVALVGSLGLILGYFCPLGSRLARRLHPSPDASRPDRVLIYSVGLAVLAVIGYASFAAGAGVSTRGLANGGLEGRGTSTAYLYYAPFLLIPVALLLTRSGWACGSRGLRAIGAACVLPLMNSLTSAGQRLWIFVIISAFTVYHYLRRGTRPHLAAVLTVVVIGLIAIVSLRDVAFGVTSSSLTASFHRTLEAPGGAIRTLLTGEDTEMLNGLALEVQAVPDEIPFRPGYASETFVSQPIPRLLWPNKPRQAEDLLNERFFGGQGYRAGNPGVAYSVLGDLYFDSGFLGVTLGMTAIGILLRALFEYFQRYSHNDAVCLVYAATLPFVVVLMRGNLQDTFARILFVVLPILLVLRWSAAERRAIDPDFILGGSANLPKQR